MRRVLVWLWNRGIVSTFLTGFFVVLPIAITLGIMGWVGALLVDWLGPQSYVGQAFSAVGLQYFANEYLVTAVGWAIVLAAIWLLGLLVKTSGKSQLDRAFHAAVERIPVMNIFYRPVVQLVDMFKKEGREDMQGMGVVFCRFGAEHGAGILGLLASRDVYRFNGQDCHIVYVPTSPIPMSGGIVFVPTGSVQKVDMAVDDLMQIYFSIGVMAPKAVPQRYVASVAAD